MLSIMVLREKYVMRVPLLSLFQEQKTYQIRIKKVPIFF